MNAVTASSDGEDLGDAAGAQRAGGGRAKRLDALEGARRLRGERRRRPQLTLRERPVVLRVRCSRAPERLRRRGDRRVGLRLSDQQPVERRRRARVEAGAAGHGRRLGTGDGDLVPEVPIRLAVPYREHRGRALPVDRGEGIQGGVDRRGARLSGTGQRRARAAAAAVPGGRLAQLNMFRNGLKPGFGSPGSSFGVQQRPVPQDTSPGLHEQPRNPHCSRPVQQIPLHGLVPSGQCFTQTGSPRKLDSQYSFSPQHASPQSVPLQTQSPNDFPHVSPVLQHQPRTSLWDLLQMPSCVVDVAEQNRDDGHRRS